jgi:hypothetical protein
MAGRSLAVDGGWDAPGANPADTGAGSLDLGAFTPVAGEPGAPCDDWRPDGIIGPGMLRSGRFRLCHPGLTCELPAGQCGGPGSSRSGLCIQRPQACDAILAPVCGCDHRTYGNDCARVSAGVALASTGACPLAAEGDLCGGVAGIGCAQGLFCDPSASDCQRAAAPETTGFCRPRSTSCPAEVHPVCGCDGLTYNNDCSRLAAGVFKLQNGICGVDCDGLSRQASTILADALASAVQCSVDTDCQPIPLPFRCLGGCGPVIGGDAVRAAIAAQANAIAQLCSRFEQAGCVLIAPPCPPPIGGLRCQQGKCTSP